MNTKKSKGVTQGPSKLFDEAFEDAEKLLAAEEQLQRAHNASTRARLKKTIKERGAWLTRRTDRNHEMNRLASQYIALHNGKVSNIADLVNYLSDNGVQIVPDKSQGRGHTERAVRLHLQKVFGIGGVPGRKPKEI